MPVDTAQILSEAEKLGKLVAQHPAVAKYKQAQKAVAEDRDASGLLAEFDRQLGELSRQEQSGMALTTAQRQKLETLQNQIISHIKIKALNIAQVDFYDLLRKVSQTIQRPVLGQQAAAGSSAQPPVGAHL